MLGVAAVCAVSSAQYQDYTPQTQPEHSVMYGLGWEEIKDTTFSGWLGSTLLSGGNSNARGASILMEQCYGGGMFDEVNSELAGKVPWVGGSAARHDESSWGEGDDADHPMDYWTRALGYSVAFGSIFHAPVIDNVNGARNFDSAGPNGNGAEHPQSLYRNGGETINFEDTGASSYHAILWAGNANGIRHNNDIKMMNDLLKAEWAGHDYTITVLGDNTALGGIASDTATADHLHTAMDDVAAEMDPNSDFVFYASDHGGQDTYWDLQQTLIEIGSIHFHFTLSDDVMAGIRRTADGIPILSLSLEGLTEEGIHVLLNGDDLGDVYDQFLRTGKTDFELPRDLVLNTGPDGFNVELVNQSRGSVTLDSGYFGSGGIDNVIQDLPAVPEPGTFVILGALAGLVFKRRA